MALSPIEFRSAKDQGVYEFEARVRLLSPVFGGGVRTHVGDATHHKPFDPITPMRAPSIRGHLRFWWRATSGCLYPSLTEMRDREQALFGGVAGGTPVHGRVAIDVDASGMNAKPLVVFDNEKNPVSHRYKSVAFALAPKDKYRGHDSGVLWEYGNSAFTVGVTIRACDDLDRTEIDLAWRAWLLVGGVGGRTRRGLGAVTSDYVDDFVKLKGALAAHRATDTAPPLSGTVPSLHFASPVFETKRQDDVHELDAWWRMLGLYVQFRQARRPGYHRSYWPEPDVIRSTRVGGGAYLPNTAVRAFPRAQFGLPIVFQFRTDDHRGADPDNPVEVTPANAKRWPSPLIMRPQANGDALAVRLQARHPKEVEVAGASQGMVNWPLKLTDGDRAALAGQQPGDLETRVNPNGADPGDFAAIANDPDMITAFFNWLQDRI